MAEIIENIWQRELREAKEQAWREGFREGWIKGFREGWIEGWREGFRKGWRESARQGDPGGQLGVKQQLARELLLDGTYKVDMIAQLTGLTIEEVEALRDARH